MSLDIVSIDPGMSTGMVVAEVSEHRPLEVKSVHQIEGGLASLRTSGLMHYVYEADTVIVELFKPRQMARSYRLNELEPLRIEGYLEARFAEHDVEWWGREPAQRKLVNGFMSASEDALKAMGLWTLPSDVGCKDANDVNAAMMHLVSWLRSAGHAPTLSELAEATA